MHGDGVANTLAAVSNELSCRSGSVTVDGLGIASLRGVGSILLGGQAKDIGPLLERLLVVGVAERGIGGAVPAAMISRLAFFLSCTMLSTQPNI